MSQSRFSGFLGNALKYSKNITEVRTPFSTENMNDALSTIADFVQGALSEAVLNSFVYVSDNAISVTGHDTDERLVLHPGYFYFDETTIDTVDAKTVTYVLPLESALRYAKLETVTKSVGWFLVLTATNRTQGFVRLKVKFDGIEVSREIQVPYDSPVAVFIPGRGHLTGENKTYAIVGTGTFPDQYVVTAASSPTLNSSKALFKQVDFPAGALTLEFQDVQIEAELLPATFPYVRKYFGE